MEARVAVAAALEAAATQHDLPDEADPDDVPELLAPFVARRAHGAGMLGVSAAAARLRVSRTTIYDWIEKRTLLGWRSTRRGMVVPGEQILGPGKVVPGLRELLAVIEDPELAWAFLSEEWPFESETARPIDKLAAGKVEEVVGAAPSFGTAVT